MNASLKNEMETLIIPLYGKARMSQAGVFKDPYAEAAMETLGYDYAKLRIRNKTQVMLAMRAAIIDDFSRSFIEENPDCLVLHLGCGLDARFMRLGLPVHTWYDLDFPQVIDIKRQLYRETDSYRYIASSVADHKWMDGIQAGERAVLVVAEGLFMYLSESEIKALFSALKSKFKRCTLVFDAYSKLTAKSAKHHPSLKRTGATIRWGVDDPRELEGYASGVKHLKTLYLTEKSSIQTLPRSYRMMFRFAGLFRSAREAHRVYVISIGD